MAKETVSNANQEKQMGHKFIWYSNKDAYNLEEWNDSKF